MAAALKIAITAGNGIGGTEKAATLFATELVRRGHRVFCIMPAGSRDPMIREGGAFQVEPHRTPKALSEFLVAEKIDVIHQHVPGYPMPNPNYEALALLGNNRPRLIETNVFGRLEDAASNRWVDFRVFVSKASSVQAFSRYSRRMSGEALNPNTVLYNPLPPLRTYTKETRDRIRAEYGIRADEIFILRLGRPGHKWNRDEVRAFKRARRRNQNLRLLLMEPSPSIWREVEKGTWGEGILLRRAVSDFDQVAALYSAGDMMLHTPNWGESYGYTIAEAMQCSLPVVTNTTPWGDNAQTELVEDEKTGYVCNSHEGAAHAVLKLAGNSALRTEMGAAGTSRISGLSDLSRETDLLEEIMEHVLGRTHCPKIAARNAEVLKFQKTFATLETWVYERRRPQLFFAFWKGLAYSAYRNFRSAAARKARETRSGESLDEYFPIEATREKINT